jgi:hypothetical protein
MIIYFKEHKKIFFLLFALVFLYYGNSLKNKYALDDDYVTVTNFPIKGKEKEYIPNHNLVSKGFKGILKIWKSRYAHDSESSFDYRPVTTTSFAIEYAIFGQSPFMSHLINMLLYFFCVWLIFCVLIKLLNQHEYKINIAFFCALLFLIHPIHTEVVNNIKCRDELLAFSFSMLSFWYCLKAYDKITLKHLVLIVVFLVLGLLSKKSTMLFLGIIPLSFVVYRKLNLKHLYLLVTALILTFAIIFMFKSNVVTEEIKRTFYHFENPLYTDHFSFYEKLFIGLKCFGFYTKLLFIPYPLRVYYGGNLIDFSASLDINFIVGILYLVLSIYLIFKYKNRLFIFATLFYLGCLFPFVNFASPSPGVLAERFIFCASLGFCLVLTTGLLIFLKNFSFQSYAQLFSKPMIYVTTVVVISMVYTWSRNNDWKDKLSLFEHDITHLEKSAKANSLLANEYFEMLRSPNKKYSNQVLIDKSLKHYNLSVKNDSSFFTAYNNAGVIYYSYLKDIASAKKYFLLAIRHRPLYAQAYENLGNCYKLEKNTEKAIESYKKSIEINPEQYTAYTSAIYLYFEQKKYDQAIKLITVANSTFVNNYELIAQEANCYLMKGDTLKAIDKYEEAYTVYPNQNLAQYLSQKYKETGDTAKADFYKNK